jgi:predicted metalloprotease with PDZ domain
MPQGLPQDGDRGLDLTPTWGRTYWGGAIFCMLADIEIRKLTDNQKSLRDALRGVLDAGLSMHADTSAMQVFEAGDRAIGVAVLVPLYQKMKADPYPVDLNALWSSLGVTLQNQQVVYNDQAPMAHIRKRLLKS